MGLEHGYVTLLVPVTVLVMSQGRVWGGAVMAYWLHRIFMSVSWFVRPRCGCYLSLC